jgi:pyruvate dehydrogenase E2 component (dihydrolipoamide acetyltransferase)
MKLFKLPDLGEGLPDAQIREWYVAEGDTVKADQPLAAMETAKALVDVPAPYAGRIEKLFGQPGDTIETGNPLVGFEGEAEPEALPKDSGTVVGKIEESGKIWVESDVSLSSELPPAATSRVKATPAVRVLARELGIDLNTLTPRQGDTLTADDVKAAAQSSAQKAATPEPLPPGWEYLPAVRRAMVMSMTQAHQEIVPVTLTEDVDIHAWEPGQDATVRFIRAIQAACQVEPTLNVHFDGGHLATLPLKDINLGIAVDTHHGLYVPVIKNVAEHSNEELRNTINRFKTQAQDRRIPQEDLRGASIMLSNFGSFAGKYATPILVPPLVSIIGIGKKRDSVVPYEGQIVIHPIVPLSLTVDHRAVTGGEAARFLKALVDALMLPTANS